MKDYFSPCCDEERIGKLSSLALAHVGDGVFELLVRTWLSESGRATSEKLHNETVKLVNAKAQAGFMLLIDPVLSEEERTVFKRGRNSRVNSVPKHMGIADYHAATGFEALFGWLWLMGRKERLSELFEIIVQSLI